MQGLEKALDDVFKKAPQMPENARKGLATALPWISLVIGVIALLTAWQLYRAATVLDSLYATFGYLAPTSGLSVTVWIGLLLLVVMGVLSLVAFPALRAHKKSGWNMLLWIILTYLVYDIVVYAVTYFQIGELILSLIGDAVALYLLFQVRSYFGGAAVTPKTTPTTPPVTPTEPKQ